MKKLSKKLLAIIVSAMVMVLFAMPVFAANVYTAVTLDESTGKFTFPEKLYVSVANSPVPTVTYRYTINGTVQAYVDKVYSGEGEDRKLDSSTNYGLIKTVTVPNGKPTITSSVSFNNNDTLDTTTEAGKRFVSKNVAVDLSGIKFTEPGVFFWKVNKTKDNTDSHITNNRETFFIVVRVEDDNGSLKVASKGIAHVNADGDQPVTSDKATHIEDEYTGETHELSFEKVVAGNQGSRNRYFLFKLTIENATSIAGTSVKVTTSDAPGTANADLLYSETANYTNPTNIAIDGGGKGEAKYWLKHGENIAIPNLTNGVKYTLQEVDANKDGYTVASDVTGDNYTNKAHDKVVDDSLDANAHVKFTNTKSGTIPTGILTVIAPGVAAIIIALIGISFVVVNKRRKNERTAR